MELSALFLLGSRASLCAGGCEGGSVRTMPQACRGAPGPVVASHEAAVARGDRELARVIGVRLWEEVQAPHVAQAQGLLRPEAPAEHLDGRGPLGVGIFWELFFEHVGLAPLAARTTAQESQELVVQGLQVVLVALLLPRYVLMLKQRAVPVTSCAHGTGCDPWSRGLWTPRPGAS